MALLSGIDVGAIVILLYGLVGTLAGFSGTLMASRLGVGQPIVGQGFEFDVIVAIILGGTGMEVGAVPQLPLSCLQEERRTRVGRSTTRRELMNLCSTMWIRSVSALLPISKAGQDTEVRESMPDIGMSPYPTSDSPWGPSGRAPPLPCGYRTRSGRFRRTPR